MNIERFREQHLTARTPTDLRNGKSNVLGVKGSRVQIPPSRQLLQVRGNFTGQVGGLKIF